MVDKVKVEVDTIKLGNSTFPMTTHLPIDALFGDVELFALAMLDLAAYTTAALGKKIIKRE